MEACNSRAVMSEDPMEASGLRLRRNIFVPGMTPNVRAGGSKGMQRRFRPRGRPPEELSIQRAMTTGDGLPAGGGLRTNDPDGVTGGSGGGPPAPQHSLSGMLKLDVRYVDAIEEAPWQCPQAYLGGSDRFDEPAVPGLGWRSPMRPSKSSPAALAMHSRQLQPQQQQQAAGGFSTKNPREAFATNANVNTIAGYRGFDQSPPPSASKSPKGAVTNNNSAFESPFCGQGGGIANSTADLLKENPIELLPTAGPASKQFRWRQAMPKSRLLSTLKDRTGGSKMRRQKKGTFAPPAGGVRGDLTERTGLRGVTSSDTL